MPFKKRQTLPNYRRIKSSKEFELALATSFGNNKWFAVHVCGNKAGVSRLGIVVSKRVAPHSVARNFVKRLIREEFRRNFPAKYAVDVVVRLRRPLNHGVLHEGQKALAQLLGEVQKNAATLD